MAARQATLHLQLASLAAGAKGGFNWMVILFPGPWWQ